MLRKEWGHFSKSGLRVGAEDRLELNWLRSHSTLPDDSEPGITPGRYRHVRQSSVRATGCLSGSTTSGRIDISRRG